MSESKVDSIEVSGVTVLAGPKLRDWLASIDSDPATAMDREAIDSAWETLARIAADTDRRELGARGPTFRTPMRHLIDLVVGLATGLIAFTTAVLLFRWVGVLAVLPVIALTGGALVALRAPLTNLPLRVVGLGATVGYFAFLVLIVVLYAYFALVRT
jgi:hypothetical protein